MIPIKLVKNFVLLPRENSLHGDQDSETSHCASSCPLTGDLTSSICVCGCVVNGVGTTYGSDMSILS